MLAECVYSPWAIGLVLGRVLESMSVPVVAGGGASTSGTRLAVFMCIWMVYPSTHSSWLVWLGRHCGAASVFNQGTIGLVCVCSYKAAYNTCTVLCEVSTWDWHPRGA
jgi:hypothetical protein